jgi:hypothetical protein
MPQDFPDTPTAPSVRIPFGRQVLPREAPEDGRPVQEGEGG